jgi:hypothetical protein
LSSGQGDSIQIIRRCRLGESDIRFTEAPRSLVRGFSLWPAYSLGPPKKREVGPPKMFSSRPLTAPWSFGAKISLH